jgi:hypothetical protein
MQDYQRLLADYRKTMRDASDSQGVTIQGQNPDLNRAVEQKELKKACITLVTGQQYEAFGAVELSAEKYPQVLMANAEKHGSYARFFEEAFEWEQMMYFSPVSVAPEMLDRLRESGPIRYLVAPTELHVWRPEEWHALFPEAEMWAPPQIPSEFKRLPFAGVLGDAPPQRWADDLDQLRFKGNFFIEEACFLHKRSRTLILADFIQNHPIAPGKPILNALRKLAGFAYPHGGVPLDIRLCFTDRTLAGRSLEKLLSWDFR